MVLLLTLSSCIAAIAIVAIVATPIVKKESKRVVFTGREHHTFPSHTEK